MRFGIIYIRKAKFVIQILRYSVKELGVIKRLKDYFAQLPGMGYIIIISIADYKNNRDLGLVALFNQPSLFKRLQSVLVTNPSSSMTNIFFLLSFSIRDLFIMRPIPILKFRKL